MPKLQFKPVTVTYDELDVITVELDNKSELLDERFHLSIPTAITLHTLLGLAIVEQEHYKKEKENSRRS
jgi:hypothetical protein